jgi:hypothetical protein
LWPARTVSSFKDRKIGAYFYWPDHFRKLSKQEEEEEEEEEVAL